MATLLLTTLLSILLGLGILAALFLICAAFLKGIEEL